VREAGKEGKKEKKKSNSHFSRKEKGGGGALEKNSLFIPFWSRWEGIRFPSTYSHRESVAGCPQGGWSSPLSKNGRK